MTHDPDVLRGHIRNPRYGRVSHGLFLIRQDADPEHVDPAEWFRELGAWLAVLPDDARFTHLTGAALLGWELPPRPELTPVFAATNRENRPRRLGLHVSRLTHESTVLVRHGLPIESPAEILLRAARDLAHLDLVALVDSARGHGDVDGSSMNAVLTSSRPGVVALRRAWEWSTGESDSTWETHLASFCRVIGLDVLPHVNLVDASGGFVAEADLLIVGTRNLLEYDGAVHRSRAVHRRDLARERRLADAAYSRRGYTSDDLLNDDLAMLREIDRLLGRPHRPERLLRWRALVAASCLSKAGRDRLTNRWLGKPPGV